MNHLAGQTSPYLLQHVENPVDWYPWGEEAFVRAREEGKPIFLSVGYSTCHWCHVMAHESFEDERIAEILNRYYISVKVDREERPDVDSVYMKVCQKFTGGGGWPMSIFLTPDKLPFYAGTYFPPRAVSGMPGFDQVLLVLAQKWREDRDGLIQSAEGVRDRLLAEETGVELKVQESAKATPGSKIGIKPESAAGTEMESQLQSDLTRLTEEAVSWFSRTFDAEYGGFGSAPKFPTPHNLLFLLAYGVRRMGTAPDVTGETAGMTEKTLLQMRKGGIFDQIGFGFSRYSTDRFYLIPHFEKMLYDNALLIAVYAVGYSVTGRDEFLLTAEQTAEYLLREMRDSGGGFYCAQDADSEGGEGKYYVFGRKEILRVLGKRAGAEVCEHFGVTERGNFEGENVPNLLHKDDSSPWRDIFDSFPEQRRELYDYRRKRMALHLDDKCLASWNGMAAAAFVLLYRVTGKESYRHVAEETAAFIRRELSEHGDGNRLKISYRDGKSSGNGLLDDYAFVVTALLELFSANGTERDLAEAESLYREAEKLFYDRERGGFFLYGESQEELLLRPKETYDGAVPSGNSQMAYNLVRLWQITGKTDYRERAEEQFRYLAGAAEGYPAGSSMFLLAYLLYQKPAEHITIVPEPAADAGEPESLWTKLPLTSVVRILPDETPEYPRKNDKITYYVCRAHTCLPPENFYPDKNKILHPQD